TTTTGRSRASICAELSLRRTGARPGCRSAVVRAVDGVPALVSEDAARTDQASVDDVVLDLRARRVDDAHVRKDVGALNGPAIGEVLELDRAMDDVTGAVVPEEVVS